MNATDEIRVKMIGHGNRDMWVRQLPHGGPVWGRCRFLLDRTEPDYDWAVAYEDISPWPGKSKSSACESLACPRRNTLLITAEPSSIKFYGHRFTTQFGVVLTSQEDWALPHPDRIFSQPALQWFYGGPTDCDSAFDFMVAHPPEDKQADLSMVYSPKRMRHTLHRQRNHFMRQLMEALPDMQVFGRGARPLADKSEALDGFRYHVAVENHIGRHHWTEKLADAFLGMTLPFYAGCPNADEYFPAESFIPIDLHDPEAAAGIIRRAIADNEYEKRLPAIREARRRVMYEYNLFAVLEREIVARHSTDVPQQDDAVLYSRYALRRRSLSTRIADALGKLGSRIQHRRRGVGSR
ncbi:MAG: hypothetical protein KDI88_13245 [Gammaproteobacteria bacterium]|nr:hypothetical protein [Gammaproteobacteria bacterium]